MKKLMMMLVLITVLTTGCTTSTIVKVPVWTPPIITMPEKPMLTSDGNGSDGDVARTLSVDLLKMNEYTTILENTLKAIISTSVVPTTELNPIINK